MVQAIALLEHLSVLWDRSRIVKIPLRQPVLVIVRAGLSLQVAGRSDILAVRRETVERPFGSIKQRVNQDAFLMRGLEKVRAEFGLTALAYDLRRTIIIIGVPGLMRTVQAGIAAGTIQVAYPDAAGAIPSASSGSGGVLIA